MDHVLSRRERGSGSCHEQQENLKGWQQLREKFIAKRNLGLGDEDNKVCPYGAHVSGNSGYVTADDGTSEFGTYLTWEF